MQWTAKFLSLFIEKICYIMLIWHMHLISDHICILSSLCSTPLCETFTLPLFFLILPLSRLLATRSYYIWRLILCLTLFHVLYRAKDSNISQQSQWKVSVYISLVWVICGISYYPLHSISGDSKLYIIWLSFLPPVLDNWKAACGEDTEETLASLKSLCHSSFYFHL